MREELPVELNVQVFLPLKCHRLFGSLASLVASALIRRVAVSRLPLSLSHAEKETS